MNILLTCAGRRNYIVEYFKTELLDINDKVYAANSHEYSTALNLADKGFLVPSIYSQSYIDVLIKLCHQYHINAIIPLFDLELPILSRSIERLKNEGVTTIVSYPNVIDICNDKWLTSRYLSEIGIRNPKTFIDLAKTFNALSNSKITFPLILKPRWGMGSIGIMEAKDENELMYCYSKLREIIDKSYIRVESQKDFEKCILIQEKIIGQEYGLDVINNLQGDYVVTFIKKKLAMRSGETDVAETVYENKLDNIGKLLGSKLGHIANLDVDVFLNDDGAFVLEMNPRIGGGYPFSHLAGVNLPKAIIAWLKGKEPDKSCFDIKYGVVGMKGIQPVILNRLNFSKII